MKIDKEQITLKIETRIQVRVDDKTGKPIARITPVLTMYPFATGELRFAYWEVWSDEGNDALEIAKKNAIANVKEIMGLDE